MAAFCSAVMFREGVVGLDMRLRGVGAVGVGLWDFLERWRGGEEAGG